jgi:hypothetical protein
MLKKIAIVGALSLFGYTVFKQVFFLDASTLYDDNVDSGAIGYKVDHDE